MADFSNNSTVSFTPEDVNIRKDAYLHYFMAICLFWYQEFHLPEEYENVHIQHIIQLNGLSNNFDGHTMGGEKFGTLIKADNLSFTEPIFNRNWPEQDDRLPGGHNFFFGNTDSSFVFYSPEHPTRNVDNPMGQGGILSEVIIIPQQLLEKSPRVKQERFKEL